jgi:NADH:ubiquinone oxidoreductase subunit F (NADH-binding)
MRAVTDAAVNTARKAGSPVVVANGTEGEPASDKDKILLALAPHLVVDGMVAAAHAVGAKRAILCIDRGNRHAIASARRAQHERAGRDPIKIEIAEAPPRYTTGEETALVSWLNGGLAKPTFVPPRPFQRGVGGAPTLVDNVETLAHVALIARFGADAYRLAGDPDEPGTMLLTVGGGVRRPGVYEWEIGKPMADILDVAGAGPFTGALIGGYFGSWLTPDEVRGAHLSTRSLRSVGASLGCGLVAVMPADRCPLQEVSGVMHWLAASSAGQCGACVNGLPAVAGAFDEAIRDDRDGAASARLDRWSPMVVGRGACKLPDGAIRFLDSARRVFAGHLDDHRRYGPCPANPSPLLPTPRPGGWQ